MSDIKYHISHIKSQLASAYPADEALALAWWIAEEITGLSRTELQFGCKDTKNFAHTQEIIDRLLRFEPIQYIFGHTVWYGLDLKVTPATLIPRPETAELVEQILNFKCQISILNSQFSNAPIRVLDIGTGTGCIAIALKKARPEWQVTGIDISPEAVAVARENALRNHVEVDFRVADIFSDEIDKTFHTASADRSRPCRDKNYQLSTFNLIVSNPPYICESEKKDMRPNVLDYEPASALFVPDSDPLRFYRRIAQLFSRHSSSVIHHPSPSVLFFEINEAYAAEVAAMMAEAGYTNIRITQDIYGKDRIIEGRMAQ